MPNWGFKTCCGPTMGRPTWRPPLQNIEAATGAMAEPTSMTSSRPARRFDWNNLGMRAASAAVLIPAVLGSIFLGPVFLVVIAIAVALLAFEWTGMSAGRTRG